MISFRALAVAAGFSILGSAVSSTAFAADVLPDYSLPAVSALNGKAEIYGGWVRMDGFSDSADLKGGLSLSAPLGERFGVQADLGAANSLGTTKGGGAMHFFTRDPRSYLVGVVGGALWTDNANAQYVGPEFELYSGPLMLQATAGFMSKSVAGISTGEFFGIGDVSFFANEDLRLHLGASTIAGFKSANAGVEYQLSDTTPVTLNLIGRVGDNGFVEADAGLKIYFGGSSKSLMRRQREDDPPNRVLDIFNGAGSAFVPPPPPAPVDPCKVDPESCLR